MSLGAVISLFIWRRWRCVVGVLLPTVPNGPSSLMLLSDRFRTTRSKISLASPSCAAMAITVSLNDAPGGVPSVARKALRATRPSAASSASLRGPWIARIAGSEPDSTLVAAPSNSGHSIASHSAPKLVTQNVAATSTTEAVRFLLFPTPCMGEG